MNAIPWNEEEDKALRALAACGREWNTAEEAFVEWKPIFKRRSTASIRARLKFIELEVPLKPAVDDQLLDEFLSLREEV